MIFSTADSAAGRQLTRRRGGAEKREERREERGERRKDSWLGCAN